MKQSRILIVEDDPAHQRLLSIIIERGLSGTTISTAADAQEFRSRIRSESFDCVVMDFLLPDCHVPELLMELRAIAPNCPTIVISSSDDRQIVIDSIRNGVIDFIPKQDAFTSDALCERIGRTLSEQKRQEGERRQADRRKRELVRQAIRDHLTGLYNRRYMDERLNQLSRVSSDHRGNVSLAMLDIDHFKKINDTHGHAVGDIVLQAVAQKIRESCSEADVVARWGGEEFLILKVGTSSVRAITWAEQLRRTIRAMGVKTNGTSINVTVSAGVVNVPAGEVLDEAVEKADKALYLAKEHGRDRMFPGEMVAFQQMASQADATTEGPLEKLKEILKQSQARLGPTQWEDLTRGSYDVSRAVVRLGKNIGVSPPILEHLRTAGLCHDLGKFVIPESLLAKKTPLSSEERELISLHSVLGTELALMLGLDRESTDYIRYHHRRYDDNKLIDGVNGRSTPLGARLLHIADALVAMTTDRPYQKKRTKQEAINELRRESGGQFDPTLLDKTCEAAATDELVGTT